MIVADRLKLLVPSAVRARWLVFKKAASFALIGVLNTTIDAGVFFLAYAYLTSSPSAAGALEAVAAACKCGRVSDITLVASNVMGWFVAVSCSYAMNSFITFAAESGRKLSWRSYAAFVASGLLGVAANTTVLVIAAMFIPVWAAKGCAILVSFLVNFSMSHFVVFRAPRSAGS